MITTILFSQWGSAPVSLRVTSSNATIYEVLVKACHSIVAEGYIMRRLIVEFTDADSAVPEQLVDLRSEDDVSLYDILAENQSRSVWVEAEPKRPAAPAHLDPLQVRPVPYAARQCISQWGRVNVVLHRISSNFGIREVLEKAGASLVPEGYMPLRLILEYTDDELAAPDFYVGLHPNTDKSLFELLVEKEMAGGWIWVQTEPLAPRQAPPAPIPPPPHCNRLHHKLPQFNVWHLFPTLFRDRVFHLCT